MDKRSFEIETASGAASLGRLADQVVLAAIHAEMGRPLSEVDHSALEAAARVLDDVANIRSNAVAPVQERLHAMTPVGVIDETVEAVTSASDPNTNQVEDKLRALADDVRALMTGTSDHESTERVRQFFDRISRITLARSTQLAGKPIGDELWTQEASSSLTN